MAFGARILADSRSPDGVRLTSFEVTFPRPVLAEFNTHRLFSRNSASSRAIPVKKMIERVLEDPYIPTSWGKNQKGMQAGEEVDQRTQWQAHEWWLMARDAAVDHAWKLLDLGIHKQITNRLLEPFMWHTVIVTATEWDNFFHLRNNPNAHPDIQVPAAMMQELYEELEPQQLCYGQWHLPLVDPVLENVDPDRSKAHWLYWTKVSVGRCARVSYLTHDGKRDPQADIELHDRLLEAGHMCFDDKTEVLTRSGWKAWPQVSEHDSVYAVDVSEGTGKFERPTALHAYDVDEELYSVNGQQLDLFVTQNHRMVVSARRHDGTWGEFGFEEAGQLLGCPRRYLKSVRCAVRRRSLLPPGTPPHASQMDFLRLLGFAIGDGYSVGGNQISFHLKKQRKIDYLHSLDFDVVALANHKFVVSAEGLGAWFRESCYTLDKQKRLPMWVLELDEQHAQALFDGLRNSDGFIRRSAWAYSTTSQQVADVLQALLHIHGKVGSLSYVPYGDDGRRAIRVNVSDRTTPRVEIGQVGRSLSYEEKLVRYRGRVYCATTTTGAMLVRRNGHVVVSGNSPFEHVARPATAFDWVSGSVVAQPQWVADAGKFVPPRRQWHGNFRGWVQYRKLIPGEADILGNRGGA